MSGARNRLFYFIKTVCITCPYTPFNNREGCIPKRALKLREKWEKLSKPSSNKAEDGFSFFWVISL